MAVKGDNVYRTSRRAYFWNYVLAGMVAVFLYLLITTFGLTFSLIPTTVTQLWNTLLILGVVMVISVLSEEPIIAGMFRYYVLGENEIIQVDGMLRKKKFVLPYQGIADVRVNKGILGRILNFGDVEVFGFKDNVEMRGMVDPENIQRIVQDRMAKRPSTLVSRQRHHEEEQKDE
jgi:uncharacterized membrane protein YdbT with pleckstrin-like domain